jgi:hypothetical protein
MMNRVIMTGLLALMFLGLVAIGFSFFHQLACEGQPINNNVAPTSEQQIFGERIIGQSFVAPREGLNRIDILFQTYRRRNTADITLRLLELPDETGNPFETGTERFKTTFNAATLRDQSWRSFTFAPIVDSAGKHYLITLQSPEAVSGSAATVGGIERDVYAPGSAYLGPIPIRADMTFRTCYQMTAIEKLQVLSEQLTRDRPSLWGQAAFYWLSLGLYGVLLIGFFWKLTHLER